MSDNFNRFYAEIHTKHYTTVKAIVKAAWDNRQVRVQSLEQENAILREALGAIANCNYKCATDFQEWAKIALYRTGGDA